ncbi:unnamed protein product [Paramecium primaurelia]|uniref:Transmembrane protein n=1 Tax=Paramecium primaurelia TaxID=5886 RepID=A0A8S1KCA2_PARPR|nr:unnamed protein product [Paramecium primaurelia]
MFHQKRIKSKCWNSKQDFLIAILKIETKFTSIYQTYIQIPQKFLICSPLEVMLSDIYLIISADYPDFWYYVNYASYSRQTQRIHHLKYQGQIQIKRLQRRWYLKKFAHKFLITYNLTILIIQIKFEDTIKNQFSCELSIKTKGIK